MAFPGAVPCVRPQNPAPWTRPCVNGGGLHPEAFPGTPAGVQCARLPPPLSAGIPMLGLNPSCDRVRRPDFS
jgi:hypothetical protein